MKKILVVLMILAVAGGVFAQEGKWSLVGTVEIGTRLTISPVEKTGGPNQDEEVARINGIGYNWWDVPRIKVDLGYNREGLSAGLQMNTRADNEIYVAFSGQNFKAKGSVFGIEDLLFANNDTNWGSSIKNNGFDKKDNGDDSTIKRLWGEYNVLDGLVTLVAAYKSEETEYWVSDKTGTFLNKGQSTALPNQLYITQNWRGWYYMNHGFFDNWFTFSSVDETSYFLTNFKFTGFEIGAMVPNVFGNGRNRIYNVDGTNERNDKGMTRPQNAGNELVEDALKWTVIGAKFNMHPVEIAAQFSMKDYGAYFGGKFNAGPVMIGLSFQGILAPTDDSTSNKRVKVGGGVDYNAGQFGAGLKAYLDQTNYVLGERGAAFDGFNNVIGIQPYLFYLVIPSHLGFKLDTGFYFTNITNKTTDKKEDDLVWAVQPQLFWSFRGNGAKTSYAWATGGAQTGMMLRYRVISPLPAAPLVDGSTTEHKGVNFLDVVFSWSF